MSTEWNPSSNDAMSLAAFRWFANTIETFAIELYATDRDSFKAVEGVLRSTLKELQRIKVKPVVPEDDHGCPDGYVLCHGICQPSCDDLLGEAAIAERQPPKGGKKKGGKKEGGKKSKKR